jgi:tetratricopeptide (TPR) repeat protein
MGKKRKQGLPVAGRGAPADRKSDPGPAFWMLCIAGAAVLVYLNAFGHEFVLDDTRIIRDNLRIRSLANVPDLFRSSYWGIAGAQSLYRPLVLVTYAVNYAVNGLSTFGYTAVNVVLHAAVSVLLFSLVRSLGASRVAAGIVGIAFAVHPVHTEAVTGIAGRTELLAAFFFLIALLCHRVFARSQQWAYAAAAWVAFACALLSKESAITLLLVIPLIDVLFRPNTSGEPPRPILSRVVNSYLPLLAVAIAYLLVRHAVLGSITISEGTIAPLDNPLVPISTMPLGERLGATKIEALLTPFAVVLEYARLLVWPVRLSPDYSYNQIPLVVSPADVRFLGGLLIIAACLYGIVAAWRRNPLAAFGLAFLAVTFSVISNFVITIGTICAERLMYLPSAGFLIAAVAGVEWMVARKPDVRKLAYGSVALLCVLAAVRTWTRNPDWKNELSLWSAAVAVAPDSARVQSEYGRVLMTLAESEAPAGQTTIAEQHFSEAQKHFERALAIYPSYAPPMDGLATILSEHQRYDEAEVLFERAVKAWPAGSFVSLTNWAGLLWSRSSADAQQVSALRGQGRTADADALEQRADAGFRQAIEKVDRALALSPSYAHAHLIRALLLDGYLHDAPGAIREFEEVLRLAPAHPQRPEIERELARLRAAGRD